MSRPAKRGFSLIEALVALAIIHALVPDLRRVELN